MSNILFLASMELADAKRGTPQHVHYMLREIRKEHALVVCTHSVPDEFKDIFIPYPRPRGIRKLLALMGIVRSRNITHVFTIGENGLRAPVLLKIFCRVKIADELHGMGFEEKYAGRIITHSKYLALKWEVWFLLHFYDTVFYMSTKLAQYYAPMSRRWVLVRGGVDIREIADASTSARDVQELVVGYMGNARMYQGLPYLLRAVAQVRERNIPLRLNLIISGDDAEPMQELAFLKLLDITTINRNVSHEDAYRLIADSTVLVIPREDNPMTRYAFPGKLAEYLATGIPTIATQIGPVDEMKEEFGQCTILVRPDHIAENVAAALERVGRMSAQERQALGRKARAFAAQRFSWEARGNIFNDRFRL